MLPRSSNPRTYGLEVLGVLEDQVSDLIRLAQHRNMVRVKVLHGEFRTRLVDKRLRPCRGNRVVLARDNINNFEVASIRNVGRSGVQSVKGREFQPAGPVISFLCQQKAVEGFWGREILVAVGCDLARVAVVIEQRWRYVAYVFLGLGLKHLFDGRDVAGKVYKRNDAAVGFSFGKHGAE
jgi:hypothetical protein